MPAVVGILLEYNKKKQTTLNNMSLQVWLPLNKKIVNAGLGNVNVINNGVTISDSGILGKCGSFTPGQYIEFTNVPFSKLNNCSVSFWIKLDANEAEWLLLSGQGERYYLLAWRDESYNNGNFYHLGTTVQKIYVDGVESNKPIRDGNWHHYCAVGVNFSTWTKLYVNRYLNVGNSYNFTGLLNDLRIYDHALSEYDVQRIYQNRNTYEIPTVPGSPTPDLPLWVKVLHHNVPSSNLFTTANAKKNTTENLYSRLGIYFNSTIFKNPYGKYELLAKEKLESGSTEQSYQWRQTSSPTASTIAGFESIKNTNSSSRMIGLKNTNAYATFHNGSSWWCACGSYTAYQGGIPGFSDVVKSGYLDLYARARIGHLPKSYENEYEELEYIEGTGTQWIDAGVKANQDTKAEIKFEITGNATGYGAVFGSRTSYNNNAFNVWSKCGNGNIGANYCKAGAINSTIAQAENVTYYITLEKNKLSVNGNVTTFTQNTNFTTPGNIYLFNIYGGDAISKGTSNRILIGKVYSFKLYNSDIIIKNMIPSKRKSDNVIGMYDLVSKKFFTNQGTGVFNAGPSVISLPKEYEKLEYINFNGSSYIDTGIVLKSARNIEHIINAQVTNTSSSFVTLCGFMNSSTSPRYGIHVYTNKWMFGVNTTLMSTNNADSNEHTFNYITTGTTQTLYDTDRTTVLITGTFSDSDFTGNTLSLYLGARHNSDGPVNYLNGRIGRTYLKQNNIYLYDFVPAKRKSDNVIGMYDIVSGQFFTNSGTGSFTGA